MSCRIIKLSHPWTPSEQLVHTSKISNAQKSVYETVNILENRLSSISLKKKKIQNKTPLRDIINLHNHDGIKSRKQIMSMIRQLKSGIHVLSQSGLPNIKLVRDKKGKTVLFDGHHSILAYMAVGSKYLHEIPHLMVNDEKGYVDDREILAFFGEHSKKLKNADWRRYAINWQKPKEKQLCARLQKNMGELFDYLFNK